MTTKPMTAWLIMWESEHGAVAQPYVDIVSFRRNLYHVMDYVQRLHDVHRLSLVERAPAARYNKPAAPLYKAQVHRTRPGLEIRCGRDPYLVARPVKNLTVRRSERTGVETLCWMRHRL